MDSSYNFLLRDDSWLVGWSRIAKFTGCSISTCRRLKEECGMPVRRLPTGTPVAIPGELTMWLIYYNDDLEEEKRKKDDPK
jgi:hypothetical protein